MSATQAPPRLVSDTPVRKPRRDWVAVGLWLALALSALIWALPFLFMVLTSLKTQADVVQTATWELPSVPLWANYPDAVDTGDLWVTGANSLLISAVKVPLGLLLAAAAAFALARLRFRRHKLVLA